MMGLIYLFAFFIYIVIFITVVVIVVKRAKAKGKNAKTAGLLAAFVMYNLVFWDFLPTLLVHQYYCQKEAGFWVYKTAEQWRKENPDVVVGPVKPFEGMVLDKNGNSELVLADGTKWNFDTYRDGDRSLAYKKTNGEYGYWFNKDRFLFYRSNFKHDFFGVNVHKESILDSKTNEVMMEMTDVTTGKDPLRFWLHMHCSARMPKKYSTINKSFNEI